MGGLRISSQQCSTESSFLPSLFSNILSFFLHGLKIEAIAPGIISLLSVVSRKWLAGTKILKVGIIIIIFFP